MRYRDNGLGHARLGLAISKRVSKRAVERNRIKRLLRESFRRVRHQLPPVDLMVMAREQAAGVPGPELLSEIDGLWKKLLAARPGTSEPLKLVDDTTTIVR
jgi:ribonuclease P protein component